MIFQVTAVVAWRNFFRGDVNAPMYLFLLGDLVALLKTCFKIIVCVFGLGPNRCCTCLEVDNTLYYDGGLDFTGVHGRSGSKFFRDVLPLYDVLPSRDVWSLRDVQSSCDVLYLRDVWFLFLSLSYLQTFSMYCGSFLTFDALHLALRTLSFSLIAFSCSLNLNKADWIFSRQEHLPFKLIPQYIVFSLQNLLKSETSKEQQSKSEQRKIMN